MMGRKKNGPHDRKRPMKIKQRTPRLHVVFHIEFHDCQLGHCQALGLPTGRALSRLSEPTPKTSREVARARCGLSEVEQNLEWKLVWGWKQAKHGSWRRHNPFEFRRKKNDHYMIIGKQRL